MASKTWDKKNCPKQPLFISLFYSLVAKYAFIIFLWALNYAFNTIT